MKLDRRSEFIGYNKAMNILQEKWQATEEELAAWIESGCIPAYTNANELNPPPEFAFTGHPKLDYLSLLNKCWFRKGDIESFEPTDRYITGKALLKRWEYVRGGSLSFILERINESRTLPIHPTFGYTQPAFGSDNDDSWPPIEVGLFPLKDVEQIEAEEGRAQPKEGCMHARDKSETLVRSLKGKGISQQQTFRELCVDELRNYARLWAEDAPDIPINKIILFDYHSRWAEVFRHRDPDNFRCPMYVVVFEIPGLEWPPLCPDSKNWPPTEEDICAPFYLYGHPWRDFLEKLDNVPNRRFQEKSSFFYNGFEKRVYITQFADNWQREWLFVAVDDVGSLPDYVDGNGPNLVLLPLNQEDEIFSSAEKQPTGDQVLSVTEQDSDEIIWTWRKMQKFAGHDRKTISNRAGWLGIVFLERPAKRGHQPEKGLKESDLRRIINSR